MDVKSIFTKVLNEVKPKESVLNKVQPILDTIQTAATDNNVDAVVQCGGSTAKDTYLATNHDCDVFVKFNYKEYKEHDISQTLEGVLKKTPYEFTKVHGSRDYFQATILGIEYEVIPVLDVKSADEALNVTDMSPMHVKWVIDRTKDTMLTDQIRLTKQFAKAHRVYGAESYIGGFSGHIIDILVIYYGGFTQLLNASQKWIEGDIIDPMNFYKNRDDALEHLNESKIDSPLIIIDPILSERNAASALTKKRWYAFKKAAKLFLANPTFDQFLCKPLDKNDFEKGVYQLTIKPQLGKSDVVGGRCKKVFEYIKNQAIKNDFSIKRLDWEYDAEETNLFYVTKNTELKRHKIIRGPPLTMTSRCEEFAEGKEKTFEKGGFLFAEEEREFTTFSSFLKHIITTEYVTERVEKISIV